MLINQFVLVCLLVNFICILLGKKKLHFFKVRTDGIFAYINLTFEFIENVMTKFPVEMCNATRKEIH